MRCSHVSRPPGFALMPLALAALISTAGCELLREPTALDGIERAVSVHAVLRAGIDTVRVMISRAGAARGTMPHPVSGATVHVSGPEGDVVLAEARPELGRCINPQTVLSTEGEDVAAGPEPGCYAGRLPAAVGYGVRYALLAVLPSGDTIRGAATIPGLPMVLEPVGGAHVSVSDGDPVAVPFRWRPGQGTAFASVSSRVGLAFDDGRALPEAECAVSFAFESQIRDPSEPVTSQFIIFGPSCIARTDGEDGEYRRVAWDSLRVGIRLAAFDTAFARFMEEIRGESVARERAGAGLVGAAGVFAGVATAERVITLVMAEP